MHGRGFTTLLIAMMLLVGADGARRGQEAPSVTTPLSIKYLSASSWGNALTANAFGRITIGGRRAPNYSTALKPELIHAGINVRAIIAQAKKYLGQWKNSLLISYQRFPAIVIGLGGLVVLPLLAMPGLILRITRRIGRRFAARPAQSRPAAKVPEQTAWQGPCWIEVEGVCAGATKARLEGEMLRIGRERDNDICLDARSVHRYHALVHRTSEREVLITDLSGEHGNGMWVNGTRLQSVALQHGDRIQLGQVRLRYEMGSA